MHRFDHDRFRVPPESRVDLSEWATLETGGFSGKKEAKEVMERDIEALTEVQAKLWAEGRHAVLVILQAMDAAGKDGTIKHVMSGVNPQGCEVHAFKAPNDEELKHHFLWRPALKLPPKGKIGIFNRSYYEEVLVVRVHPEFLVPQKLTDEPTGDELWEKRFAEINAFERGLVGHNTTVIKFFLHLSKEEQKDRFLERIDRPEKNWKFSMADIEERQLWDRYQFCFAEMLSATSTEAAPWYVIPADKKWFARALVADIITARIEALDPQFPTLPESELERLAEARERLTSE